MREVNAATINLIEGFESLRLRAYNDGVGVMTIGFGHTDGVKHGDVITQADAEAFLREDLAEATVGVEQAVNVDLSDNEFGACVSLAFNIGVSAFARSSVCRLINRQKFDEAANAFLLWNKGGGKVMAGLTRRRKAERKLFLTPDEESDSVEIDPQDSPDDSTATTVESSPSDAPQPEPVAPQQPPAPGPTATTAPEQPVVTQTIAAIPPATTSVPGALKKLGGAVSGLSLTSIIGGMAIFKDRPDLLNVVVLLVKWVVICGAGVGAIVAVFFFLEKLHNASLANQLNIARLQNTGDKSKDNVDFSGWKDAKPEADK